MKNGLKKITIIIPFFFFYVFYSPAHDFSRINTSYRYDPDAEVNLDYQVAVSGSNATIFLKVVLHARNTLEDYTLTYGFQQNYTAKTVMDIDSIETRHHLIEQDDNISYLKLEITIPENMPLLVVNVKSKSSETSYIFDIPLKSESDYPSANLVIMERSRDIPLFRNYIHQNEPFRIVSVYEETPEVFLYQYKQVFKPAAPPMAEKIQNVDKSLTIDSLFTLPANENINLKTKALYFVQTDTSTLEGISFRITGEYYPEYATAENLIAPLVYISTTSEIKKIQRADDKKIGLDRFWLDVTNSQTRAKNIIRQFYNQTEQVNRIFTTYKAGWKTDHGMIYMLYGAPDEVYRNGIQEEWIYGKSDDFSKIRFTFVKVKNIFTRHHYELLRDSSYDNHWFRTVDLWRKGRKEI